jgi:phenylpropionate dioxygenase-like ring-hydroxylating dioxygenase large terminal subunit
MTGAAPSTDRIDNLHPGLRHAWHPVALSTELAAAPMRVRLLGESWVIARLPELVALPDRCPHRAAPLSRGRVVDNSIECPYHGWRFDQQGRVVVIPALGDGPVPSGCRSTPAAGVTEHLGLVWIAPEPPLAPRPRRLLRQLTTSSTSGTSPSSTPRPSPPMIPALSLSTPRRSTGGGPRSSMRRPGTTLTGPWSTASSATR